MNWEVNEQNYPKAATQFMDFGYSLNPNDGAYAVINEANALIDTICEDVNQIAQNYVRVQNMYPKFTSFADVLAANTQSLNNNFIAIKAEFQKLLTILSTMAQESQAQDTQYMTQLQDINQGLAALDTMDPTGAMAAAGAGVAAGAVTPDMSIQYIAAQAAGYTPGVDATQAGFIGGGYAGGTATGGFVMPTGQNLETVYKIIAAEGGNISPNEAVNIASTMINRARSGGWYGGNDIYKIATAKHQYVVYETGKYKSASLSPESRAAVDQLFASCAMGGNTAHGYSSFRSHGSTGYKGTVLEPGGNRYA